MRIARLPFAVAIAVGIGLLSVVLAASQPTASSTADDLVTAASPFVSETGLARMRADLEKAKAVAAAIEGPGLERLTALSGQPPPPGLEADLADARGAGELADTVISNLERRRAQFESAKSLPGLGLTLHDAVLAQIALAGLLVVGGIAGLVRPRTSLAAAVLAAGLVLVLVPVALGHPGKTSDTDALLDSLRPFTVEKVEARREALDTARTLFDGFRDDVVPRVAAQAHTSPAAVAAELGTASPLLSPQSLDETEAVLDRFRTLVAFSARIQPKLVEADELSATAGMRILIGSGLVLALAGAAGVVLRPLRPAQAEK